MNELAILLFNTYARILKKTVDGATLEPVADEAGFLELMAGRPAPTPTEEPTQAWVDARNVAASWQRIASDSERAEALLQVAGQAALDGGADLPNLARVRAVTAWLDQQKPRLATEGANIHEWIIAEALELRRSLGDQV